MNTLKLFFLTIFQFFRSLPRSVSGGIKARKQRSLQDELEAERIDRIRNPSKYRGK